MDYVFSKATEGLKSSAVREILKLTQGDSIISFAGGLPAEEFFPLDAVKNAFEEVFKQGKSSMQYGLTEGYTPLRTTICQRLALKGMSVNIDQIQMTTGSQQAIDLLSKVYINPSDVILVENPTYLAALQVFHTYQAQIVTVDSDVSGMDLSDLEVKMIQHKPRMVYVTPTFANPTGRVWSTERKKGLLELCKKHHILILEDDPYGEIKFDDQADYPTIYSLNENPVENPVLYTSTFSKTVVPALRTGWIIGDRTIIQQISRAKQAADLHSSALDQQALYHLLIHFDLDHHILTIRSEYKKRMEAMTKSLKSSGLPLIWERPLGGMFLWASFPREIQADLFLKKAIDKGVAFVPGYVFYAEQANLNTLRLNFTYSNQETMTIGVERLKEAYDEYLG